MQQWAYCPSCGASIDVRTVEGRRRAYCPSCERVHYRNPKPCAGTLVVDGDRVLLVERNDPPDAGAWSLPAGFLEWDEPPERAAVRELHEETGIEADISDLELHDTAFVDRHDGRTVLVVIYTVPAGRTTGELSAGSDAAAARFWDLEELLADEDARLEEGYEAIFRDAVGG